MGNKKQLAFWLWALAFILCWHSADAQLQSSGNGVSFSGALPSGSNTIGAVKFDTSQNTVKIDASTNTVVLGAGAAAIGTVALTTGAAAIGSITNTTFGVSAGTATIGQTIPYTGCGTTKVHQALVAVPTSATAAQTSTTCLLSLSFFNTNSSAQTVTLTDNAGTPIVGINTFSIPGNSYTVNNFPNGLELSTGFKWSAGGSGVTASYIGMQ